MPPNKASRRGTWAALSSRYYLDDKIIRVGVQAEVIYVRSLAFCAASATNGFLSDGQVSLLCRGVRGIGRRCADLVSAELWERDDVRGGYVITNWLRWNYSTERIDAASRAKRPRSRAPVGETPTRGEASMDIDVPVTVRSTPDRDGDRDIDGAVGRAPLGPARPTAPPPDLSELRALLSNRRTKIGRDDAPLPNGT